ncbi:transketolase family protein [Cytobacillus sp. Hz8]|uniref:transketolase family protein n=1 Tax=Cytobacillus sp. Hz8 TaxID=3347168 RepID=UPI0035E09677
MNNITSGRKAAEVICETLMEEGKKNRDLLVLTSDSRGSGALKPFADALPAQIIEVGIAEQNLVTISSGLAHSNKRPFAFSPSSFLSMRSIEQIKDDVAYSDTNVKLVGISGGNSYSDLGSTHHSLQDLAITRAIPNLEVYMPCDQYQTRALFKYLTHSPKPAYVRIGKKQLEDIYTNEEEAFIPGKAKIIRPGKDIAIIGSGETLSIAIHTAEELKNSGISAEVVDFATIKPLDVDMINELCEKFHAMISVEEHSIYGGLGSAIAEVVAGKVNTKLKIIGFPDEPAIAGTQDEVFDYYGISPANIAQVAKDMLLSVH